ncbi:MAG: tellurite resistance/C4-dicarboxylate transporter family protein [Sorangiineae bacterium]|nr:tellurite resistance/C4-dicarboxylate transporter family protein [Polyangiaceae bacterium]MEB2324396.1 tellurite resistance/C4-dicarboxylate transporter family protein [Sorangiineae bacterium]
MTEGARGVARFCRDAVRELYPGTFAFVMATGIISNALYILDHHALSAALLAVNLVAYVALVLATIARAARFGGRLWRDLTDPRLVFSFFTIVAGTDMLGVQLLLRGYEAVPVVLWLTALTLWILLSYFSFALLIFTNDRRGAGVVHGGWLIAIVGTQSLVLLGTLLAPTFGRFAPLTFVGVHALWGVGIVLYGVFVTLFSNRIFFFQLSPEDAMPLFWVVMGAAAISANAGSAIIVCEPIVPFLAALRPFVEGTTLVLWAWGTWWIPLFVIVGVWKHVVRRVPLAYHPMYWSLVFPLGMYSVASYRLSLAAEFPPLVAAAHVGVWVALGAWAVTVLGWVVSAARSLRAPPEPAEA